MIAVTAVGRVVNPKSTGKVLNFAIETAVPSSKEKQLCGVTVFLGPKSRIQEFVAQGTQLAVQGKLEIGEYNGKKTVRILADSRGIQLLGGKPKQQGQGSPGQKPDTPPQAQPAGDVIDNDVMDDATSPDPWQ